VIPLTNEIGRSNDMNKTSENITKSQNDFAIMKMKKEKSLKVLPISPKTPENTDS